MTQLRLSAPASRNVPEVLPRPTSPPSRHRSSATPACGRLGRRPPPRGDPRLPPFDPRQPLPWRAFFRRLAIRFRRPTVPALPVYDYNGDLFGD